MAASQEQKVDYLLKKIGYVSSKTGIAEDSGISGTKKAPFAEPIPSPLVTPSTSLWADSTLVPSTPPNSNTSYVSVYGSTNAFQLTYDNTVSGNRTFIARSTVGDQSSNILGDWIDPSFGANYAVVVYKGDPNSGGVSLAAAGSGFNDTWFFDYSSGVLNFNGTVVPTGIGTDNVYLVGYVYTGTKGVLPPAGAADFNSLNVSGISTFQGVVSISGAGNTATITGPSNLIIDPAAVGDNTGKVVILGDLQVDGTQTIINSTTLEVDDLNIVVASGATNSTEADGAGITVDGASATLQYATSGDKWIFNKEPYYNANRLLTTADAGTGNGIDADRLDGQEGTHYLDYNNFTNTPAINNATLTLQTSGNGISGSNTFTANQSADTTFTVSVSSASTNQAETLVYRDSSGGFNSGIITATSFVKATNSGGFLKADGTEDTNTYLTSYTETQTLNDVVGLGSSTSQAITVGPLNVSGISTFQGVVSISGAGNTATITGPSNLVLDPAAVGDNTGTVTIFGNLQVDGTQTIINSTTLTIDDKSIVVASGATDSASANGAGIEVDGAGATLQYSHNGARWVSNMPIQATSFSHVSGTSTQFLKADGSLDSNTYLTAESDTLNDVVSRGNTTTTNIGVGTITATKFVRSSGTSGFLKADGTEDTNTYLTSYTETQTLNDVVGLGSATTQTISVGKLAGFDALIASGDRGTVVSLAVTVDAKTSNHRYSGIGTNAYFIDGEESPFLTLTPGRKYKFDQSDSSNTNHPLKFYKDAARNTIYETNVNYINSPGSVNAYTEIDVTEDTPTVLYYQCSAHAYMGNSLNTNSSSSSVVGVSAGTYGDGRYVPQITVNGEGKISSISAVAIFNNGLGSNLNLNSYNIIGTGGANITGIITATSFQGDAANMTGLTGVGAGTYGSANTIPVVTVAADGRIESISTVLASGGGGGGGGSSAVTRTVTSFTATAGQTTFNVSYTAGTIDVFVNGSRLSAAEFTATNGTSVVLTTGASAGDIVDVAAYASSLGIELQNNGTSVGTATTINFSTDLNVSMNGNTATVTSTASGGSGSGVSEELAIAYSIAL